MGILKRLFGRNKNMRNTQGTPVHVPTWEEVVENMYDKDLSCFTDEVVKVMYSKNRDMRYVVLKSDAGYYTYTCEQLYAFYEDELAFSDDDYGYWSPADGKIKHFFDSLDHAIRELKAEPEYKNYFADDE